MTFSRRTIRRHCQLVLVENNALRDVLAVQRRCIGKHGNYDALRLSGTLTHAADVTCLSRDCWVIHLLKGHEGEKIESGRGRETTQSERKRKTPTYESESVRRTQKNPNSVWLTNQRKTRTKTNQEVAYDSFTFRSLSPYASSTRDTIIARA